LTRWWHFTISNIFCVPMWSRR